MEHIYNFQKNINRINFFYALLQAFLFNKEKVFVQLLTGISQYHNEFVVEQLVSMVVTHMILYILLLIKVKK